LIEFATHLPTTFHSKTSQATLGQGGSNEFLNHIVHAICDPQPIVRACAADALTRCLKILVERKHQSLTALLCQVHFTMMDGLQAAMKEPRDVVSATESAQHGSLLMVGTMLAITRDFMLPRFEEVCRAVLNFTSNKMALIRLEVVRLVPRLALRCPTVFGRRYLEDSLNFLLYSASTPPAVRVGIDLRPSAFTSLGHLISAMIDEETGKVIGGSNLPTIKIYNDPSGLGTGQIVELCKCGMLYAMVPDIFALVCQGLLLSKSRKNLDISTVIPALHCASSLVQALGDLAVPYIPKLIDKLFEAGLSNNVISCLQIITVNVPLLSWSTL
jgi:serine/threonine-protein kinase mTOR